MVDDDNCDKIKLKRFAESSHLLKKETTTTTKKKKKKKTKKTRQIHLVVVESHQHALEHIHYVLRLRARSQSRIASTTTTTTTTTNITPSTIGRQMQMKPWSMIHFDSHPDLACPSPRIPAAACFMPRKNWRRNKEEYGTTVLDPPPINPISSAISTVDTDDDMSAKSIDEGENLYELLDTCQSGIAEWIIPLVLAAGLSEIHWIKNDWCDQFDSGTYNFYIGAWIPPIQQENTAAAPNDIHTHEKEEIQHNTSTSKAETSIASFLDLPDRAIVKASLCHPYYLEDNSMVPMEELVLKQKIELITSQIEGVGLHTCGSTSPSNDGGCIYQPQRHNGHDRRDRDQDDKMQYNCVTGSCSDTDENNIDDRNHGWVLDICLDYFLCSNPFLTDLEAISNGGRVVHSLLRAVTQTTFKLSALSSSFSSSTEMGGDVYRSDHRAFLRLTSKLFHGLGTTIPSYNDDNNGDNFLSRFLSAKECVELYSLYSTPSLGKQLWNDVGQSLLSSTSPSNEEDGGQAGGPNINHPKEIAALIANALPSLTLPHATGPSYIGRAVENYHGDGDVSLVSSSSISNEMVLGQVKSMGDALRRAKWGTHRRKGGSDTGPYQRFTNPPFIITIARSTDDGFTPSTIVEELQAAVLSEVHGIYCDCGRKDFGIHMNEDSREELGIAESNICAFVAIFDYGILEGSTFE